MVFIHRGGEYAVIMKAYCIFLFKRLVLRCFFKDHLTGLAGIEISKEIIDINTDIADIDKQIKALQDKREAKLVSIEFKNRENAEVSERLEKFEKYITENSGVIKEFANITQLSKEQAEMAVHKQKFSQMELDEKNSNNLHEEFKRLEGRLDEYKGLRKKFIAEFTPSIKGLEVCVPDEDDPREGVFYKGMSTAELSESELWELMTILLQKLKVKILLVENISSLGTSAVETFNKFIKAGGYIFASEMERGQKKLMVTIHENIEE